MSPQLHNVSEVITQIRRRIRTRDGLRGATFTIAIAAGSLLVVALMAGVLKQRPAALIALRLAPVILTTIAAYLFLVRPLRLKLSESNLARLIEERSKLEDRLVTAVEYSESPREASPAIVDRLITDASRRTASVDLNSVVDPRNSYAYGVAAALMLLAVIAAIVFGPRSISRGLAKLYSTDSSSVAANTMFINVTPGTVRVPRNSDQKLKASLAGFDASIAQVFIRKLDSDSWIAHTMEPAKNNGEFQFVIFNIQDPVNYYVEANNIRSPEFALEVADLPFVKQIDLELDFPAYTGLANKKIENGGEVAALKGTVVKVITTLSAGAKSARIVINDGSKIEMTAVDDSHFIGDFTVKANGTYRIELTSESGERYNGSNEYDITLLEDHAPTVVIDKPGRDMKVTSVQEIFTQVRAEDDYGVSSLELYFSVNGGEEKRVQLQDLKRDAAHTLSGAHTFFLEEFKLQAGDFISYYAKARDNSAAPQESTSDIYFMEVRPFDREFRQAQQQGQAQGDDQDSNALTRRQREIIAATFRVGRELKNYTPEEKDENLGAVTLSQEKLKSDAENLAERIRRRLGDQLNSEPDFAKLVEYITQASKEMSGAIGQLRATNPKEAMPPEQRSLQQLLRAEAIFRNIQVARGGQGDSQSQQQQQQELADLFELQLDKMKNQYETVQRQQQQAQSQQQDELARKLAELARRQQQQLEQQMRSQMQQQGGGGGGSQRQQQQMIDEAQKMARELEKLSRDRRDPKLAEAAQQMQQAADDLKRAQAASSQPSSSQGGSDSTAQQLRALDRMEQARRMLESAQRAGGQQGVQQLRQQTEEALKRQEEISRSVDELARNGQGASEEKKQQLGERKQALADKVAGLERDIDQAARGMGQDRQQASDKLREAAGAIRQNRIPDRIRQNNQMIANGWYDQARERERIIKDNLEEVLKDIQAAEGSASKRAGGEGLEEALNRARELADNLESLRRRMESGDQQGQDQSSRQQQGQAGQQGSQQQAETGPQSQSQGSRSGQRNGQQARGQNQQGRNQQGRQAGKQNQQGQQSGSQAGSQQSQQSGQQAGQQSGQQQGQSQGQQNQSGRQQGQQAGEQQRGQSQQGQQGQQSGSQQGNPSNSGAEASSSMGGGPPRPGSRQLESELRQRLADAEELRRALGRNSDLGRDLNRAVDQLRRMNPNAFADPSQLALLKSEVIDPLRQIEIELARRLQAKLGNNGAGAFGDGDAPDRYRKMIEDYYRRLSARSPEAKP
jgi:hypothetical protein